MPPGTAETRRTCRWAAAFLLFSFALQAAFVLEQRGTAPTIFFRINPAFDSHRFIADARIIETEGYRGNAKKLSLHPVYPLAIAAFDKTFGDDSLAFLLFQCLLNCASFALVFWIAREMSGATEGIIALAACALYGPFVLYAEVYLREGMVIFLSLSTVALLLAARKGSAYMAAAGASAALLMLTRPYPLTILAIAALLSFRMFQHPRRENAMRFAAFIAGYAVISLLMPGPGLTDATGPLAHFLSGNVLDSNYGYTWTDTPMKMKILAESKGSSTAGIWLLLKEIAAHPYPYALFYFKKLKILLGDFEVPSNYNFYLFRDELSKILWLPFLSFGMVAPFSFLGIWTAREKLRQHPPVILWLAVSAFGVFIFPIQDRYRISLVPFLIIFAAFGIRRLYGATIQKQFKTVAAYLAVLAALFHFCRFDYSPLPGAITFEDYNNLAIAYRAAGDEQNARFYTKKTELLQRESRIP